MTVPSLFGYGFHSPTVRSSTIPPSASDRGDSWSHSSSGSGGWHSHNSKGVSPAAMSALTLLVFLFFLNILQSCLQDMNLNQSQQQTVVMVSAPGGAQAMREDMATMATVPAVMVPVTMATAPVRRSGRQKRGDPRQMSQPRWEVVRPPFPKNPPERVLIPVPLVTPGRSAENRDGDVEYEEGAGDGEEEVEEEVTPVPSPPPPPPPPPPMSRPQSVILVRPIVPLAASFRQFAWRAISAIARPLMPLLSLWRTGRDNDGASTEMCCSMLVCELDRIRESGGAFWTRLALVLRGLTLWSCPADSSIYYEKSDCRSLIADCVRRTGRHTPFSTLASLLERLVP